MENHFAKSKPGTPAQALKYPQEGDSEWDEVEKELGGSKSGKIGEEAKTGAIWGQQLRRHLNPTFIEAFVLTFLAEWGDRSQVNQKSGLANGFTWHVRRC